MKRYVRGAVLLVAAVGLASCSGDSLDPGTPARVVADPQIIFVDQGATTTTDIRVIDDLGNALDMPDFAVEVQTADISVTIDSSFRSVFDADGNKVLNPQETNVRLKVTGVGLAKTGVIVSARGVSDTIPVVVNPTAVSATESNTAPAAGDTVTLTMPSTSRLNPTSVVKTADGTTALVTNVSADGTTISFIPVPGTAGPLTVTDVSPVYAPTLKLELPTVDTVTVGSYASTDPATAHTFALPAVGDSIRIIDAILPTAVDYFYGIDITDPNTKLEITADWNGDDADLDVYDCNADCSAFVLEANGKANTDAATGNKPEVFSPTFAAAGHYNIYVNVFAPPAKAVWLTIKRVQ